MTPKLTEFDKRSLATIKARWPRKPVKRYCAGCWIGDCPLSELGLGADSTPEDIERAALETQQEATDQGAVLIVGLIERLTEMVAAAKKWKCNHLTRIRS